MNTLDELTLKVAKEQYCDDFHKWPEEYTKRVIDFAHRLVAELAKQEPAGHYCVSYFRGSAGMANTEFQPSIDFAEGTHALYAAPVIPAGWVMVPEEPTAEMCEAAEGQWMVGSNVDMAKREYKAMLAAAPKGEGK